MKIKLLRQVLVNGSDVTATPRGSIVDLSDEEAKHYIDSGIGEEAGKAEAKKAPEPANKMAAAPVNKAVAKKAARK